MLNLFIDGNEQKACAIILTAVSFVSVRLSSFLVYITCPSSDVETIIDEVRSYSYIRQKSRLESFIVQGLNVTLKGTRFNPTKDSSCNTTSSKMHSGLRLVSTEQISTTTKSSTPQDNVFLTHRSPQSPFTSAFMPNTIMDLPDRTTRIVESVKIKDETKISFQSKIQRLDSSIGISSLDTHQISENFNLDIGMLWTKTRVQPLETQIRTLTSDDELGNIADNNITKSMLASAVFIAQVDFKFLIVSMNGILCAIDQHAADERIGLERLEKALLYKVSNMHCNNKEIFVNLTKKKGISLDEMLKCVPLQRPKVVSVSSALFQIIKHNKHFIHNWQFNITLGESEREVTLVGVPGICDKVATSQDFIEFVNDVETRSTDISLIKPGFIKRSLASYACRYAIMFGDELTKDRCIQLIADLSKCDMCFICAHGRPSVVPLIDMNLIENAKFNRLNPQSIVNCCSNTEEHVPLRFRLERSYQCSSIK